ncbi:hypothetical protein [Virgibacillus alimentarius]|uniref:Uncharacterized protein n=1 Tax=Virgibacillus alimentarius TaxID=698769 RepID=A0ABS4S8Q3_9BACI|nr:hypothetical protein [Virgibacillus alimentarius]MBP2257446.1 hypothetical protein [Virgibacillus alimentarius]
MQRSWDRGAVWLCVSTGNVRISPGVGGNQPEGRKYRPEREYINRRSGSIVRNVRVSTGGAEISSVT